MRDSIKVKDSVCPKDYLKVWRGNTGVTVETLSDSFSVKRDKKRDGIGRNVATSHLVLRKDQVARLYRYLGKVLDQMEDVE